MDPERYARLSEVFNRARRLEGGVRAAYLEEACAGDPALRSEVDELLATGDTAPAEVLPNVRDNLEQIRSELLESEAAPLPSRIGHYRIVGRLGVGGMGVVYEAEQDSPRRRVALKVLHRAGVSPSRLARFDREAQLLGRLDHPGIATVHEAGIAETEIGVVPYLAMELVRGDTLLEHARRHGLSLRARIELFARVCDAVDHAHGKGVIHRDLKPANVLVTRTSDGSAQPKVLDFGVARATDSDVARLTLDTRPGQLVGTLPYMSPEQIEARPEDLDFRSDVYALGVVLFELLGGRLPYEVENLSLPEAGRIIQEEEPSRLSSIDTACRGDIETIVGKALAKEPDRRYSSAGALAADLRRFLRDEPIVARPPTSLYQLAKFIKRNRALVTGVGVAFLALVIALVVTLAQSARLRREARVNATIMAELDRLLNAADPNPFLSSQRKGSARGMTTPVGVLLRELGQRLDAGEFKDPEVEAALRYRVGMSLFHSGDWVLAKHHQARAVELRTQHLGPSHDDTMSAKIGLAWCLCMLGYVEDAERLAAEAVEHFGRRFGEGHDEWFHASMCRGVALAGHGDAAGQERIARLLLAVHDQAPDRVDFVRSGPLVILGEAAWKQGRLDEAERALNDVVALDGGGSMRDTLFVAIARAELAAIMVAKGEPDRAAELAETGIDSFVRVSGSESDWAHHFRSSLAFAAEAQGRGKDAIAIWRSTVAHATERFGLDCPRTLEYLTGLYGTLARVGNQDELRAAAKELVERGRQVAGNEGKTDLLTLRFLNFVAWRLRAERTDDARVLAAAAVARHRRKGRPTATMLNVMDTLAAIEQILGHPRKAEAIFEELLALCAEHGISAPGQRAQWLTNYARLLRVSGNPDKAHECLIAAVQELDLPEVQAPRQAREAAIDELIRACEALGRTDEASAWMRRRESR